MYLGYLNTLTEYLKQIILFNVSPFFHDLMFSFGSIIHLEIFDNLNYQFLNLKMKLIYLTCRILAPFLITTLLYNETKNNAFNKFYEHCNTFNRKYKVPMLSENNMHVKTSNYIQQKNISVDAFGHANGHLKGTQQFVWKNVSHKQAGFFGNILSLLSSSIVICESQMTYSVACKSQSIT